MIHSYILQCHQRFMNPFKCSVNACKKSEREVLILGLNDEYLRRSTQVQVNTARIIDLGIEPLEAHKDRSEVSLLSTSPG